MRPAGGDAVVGCSLRAAVSGTPTAVTDVSAASVASRTPTSGEWCFSAWFRLGGSQVALLAPCGFSPQEREFGSERGGRACLFLACRTPARAAQGGRGQQKCHPDMNHACFSIAGLPRDPSVSGAGGGGGRSPCTASRLTATGSARMEWRARGSAVRPCTPQRGGHCSGHGARVQRRWTGVT